MLIYTHDVFNIVQYVCYEFVTVSVPKFFVNELYDITDSKIYIEVISQINFQEPYKAFLMGGSHHRLLILIIPEKMSIRSMGHVRMVNILES